MAGIDHGPGLGAVPELGSGEHLGELGRRGHRRIQVQQGQGGGRSDHQPRIVQRPGVDTGGEVIAQAGESVVEGQVEQLFHGYPGSSAQGPLGLGWLGILGRLLGIPFR